MLLAQYVAPPRIQQPRIRSPYIGRTNYAAPRVYQPRIVAPITASFILSLPVAISPSKQKGCFDAIATNSTDTAARLHKVIGINTDGKQVTTVPQGSILPGQAGRFTFCNLTALLSVQFTSERSF